MTVAHSSDFPSFSEVDWLRSLTSPQPRRTQVVPVTSRAPLLLVENGRFFEGVVSHW
jgi:hypothetical protein